MADEDVVAPKLTQRENGFNATGRAISYFNPAAMQPGNFAHKIKTKARALWPPARARQGIKTVKHTV